MEDIKIKRLSKKKIQLDYSIPIYMTIDKTDTIVENINISLIFKLDTYDLNKSKYNLIEKTSHKYIENIHFKYKVGISHNVTTRYNISDIKTDMITTMLTFEEKHLTLNGFVKSYKVNDVNLLSIIRNKKIESILI